MNSPRPPFAGASAFGKGAQPATNHPATAGRTSLWSPARALPASRRYEVAYLAANGDEMSLVRTAPALPAFEMAFMAFARGTIMTTPTGPVAIEDLHPNMAVTTVEAGAQKVLWKGSTTIVPSAPGSNQLTRISTDAMGFGRPSQDLMLGPGGRVFRPGNTHGYAGTFGEARDLVDGVNVITVTPPGPVRVFHIALARHLRLIANGVEVESFHPGSRSNLNLGPDLLETYLGLFPHANELSDFGPMIAPRLTPRDAA